MPVEVSCPCCKRVEVWEAVPEAHRLAVRRAGGHRRPAEAPALAAWRILAATTAHCVGACPGCGQPLLDPSATLPSRVYALPGHERLRYQEGAFHDEDGLLDVQEARSRVEAALPPDPQRGVGRFLFTGFAAGLATLLGVGFVLGWSYAFYLAARIARGEVFTP